MGFDMERLLRLTADYQNFCSDNHVNEDNMDSDELSMEDLFLIAAATGAHVGMQDTWRAESRP